MERQGRYVGRARELEVYKRAYVVSRKAICANLAEGFAKQPHSKAEFARFISMAMGSCSEVENGSPSPSTSDTFRRHS
ncbi:four helix bundle protein [Mesorhizobium sp. B2-4-16]|uniref:four helix bundle protein n=1 Tax=unclassified Mesorhizobium TaxID=325217 RepID=UPI0032B2183B